MVDGWLAIIRGLVVMTNLQKRFKLFQKVCSHCFIFCVCIVFVYHQGLGMVDDPFHQWIKWETLRRNDSETTNHITTTESEYRMQIMTVKPLLLKAIVCFSNGFAELLQAAPGDSQRIWVCLNIGRVPRAGKNQES